MKHLFKWVQLALESLVKALENIPLPLTEGMSLWDVLKLFFYSISEGKIGNRASSIAFSFFLALFPGLLFIFTLIPYLPIAGFQDQLFDLLHDVLPPNSYDAAIGIIGDILTNRNSSLLSFGIVASLVFATNGTLSLQQNLGMTIYNIESPGFWKQYINAFLVTLVFIVVFLLSITAIILTDSVTRFLVDHGDMGESFANLIVQLRWIILLGSVFLSVCFVFYLSPSRNGQWKFVSPGAILVTILALLLSHLFRYYVINFSRYNQLYGSIGTLMVIMLWMYLNAYVLLIGYELNMSISTARKGLEKRFNLTEERKLLIDKLTQPKTPKNE